MALEEIQIDLKGIGEVLAKGNLEVPIYQRPYSWTEIQINEFFQDINTAIMTDEKEYFLGAIVIAKEVPKNPEVVDGQQRLATTAILLAAIRDYFNSVGDQDRAADVEQTFLLMKKFRTQEQVSKFKLNEVDHDFFYKKILLPADKRDESLQPTAASHKRIQKAASLAANRVNELATLTSKPMDVMADWYEYILKNAKVIAVKVPDHANAFTIFETLNDRGLDLAISDLLKNYLFHISNERFKEVQQRWLSMIGTIEAAAGESMVVTFIRQLWSSQFGLTREKELYSQIKKAITTKQKAVDFATHLMTNAKIYAAVVNTDNELWDKYGSTAKGHMMMLNSFNMTQVRPLILAMLNRFTVPEVRKGLKLLTNLAVRFTITGKLGGGALERHYSEMAKEVSDSTIKNTNELFKKMAKVSPTDKEFHSAFSFASVSKNYLARYYLTVLERCSRGEANPEFVPNTNEDEVNLEHVLPENPEKAWQIKQDVAEAHYKKIGNLALMQSDINLEAGNKNFNSKRQFLEKSKFKLTASIAKFKNWNIVEIEQRQKSLADIALKAWPLK